MSGEEVDYCLYEPPLNLVERIAAALPSLFILIAIAAPVIANVSDRAETKMGKVGSFPAYAFSFLLLHVAALLGLRFKVLWRWNETIGKALILICTAIWLWFFGALFFGPRR